MRGPTTGVAVQKLILKVKPKPGQEKWEPTDVDELRQMVLVSLFILGL